jgi:hypothetical protein
VSLLDLAIAKVEELATTPIPMCTVIPLWSDGTRRAMLKSTEDGLVLLLVANGKCSWPLSVGYIDWQADGTWRWAVSKALHGLPKSILGPVNTPDSCYAKWVEHTKKRLEV